MQASVLRRNKIDKITPLIDAGTAILLSLVTPSMS